MRALEFITGHVIYSPAYTYKFQLKTTTDHLPSPYKFELAPLPSKEIMYDELYSYTGMILKLERNSLGKLLSGFYYPTTAFAILSLISYLINPDVVSFTF